MTTRMNMVDQHHVVKSAFVDLVFSWVTTRTQKKQRRQLTKTDGYILEMLALSFHKMGLSS